MDARLTDVEIDNAWWGETNPDSPEAATNRVCDAQLRKALWWAMEFIKGYSETGASLELLRDVLGETMGIEPWVEQSS